jgi:hypothetical protein
VEPAEVPAPPKAEAKPAAPAKPTPPAVAAPVQRRNTARVHIESNYDKTALYQITAEYTGTMVEEAQRVCSAPCDEEVPSGREYYVKAPGMLGSGKFELSSGSADITVAGSSTGTRALGITGIAVGGAALGVGAFLGFVASVDSKGRLPSSFVPIAAVSAVTGTLLLVAGLVVTIGNRTTVKDADGQTLGRAAPKLRLTGNGFTF